MPKGRIVSVTGTSRCRDIGKGIANKFCFNAFHIFTIPDVLPIRCTLYSFFFFSSICCKLQAQTDSSNLHRFRFDLTGGFYAQYSYLSGDKAKEIRLPSYLSQRRPQEPELANRWGLNNALATDNPLGHGASFLRFHSWYKLLDSLQLYASLEVNNGGFSWGPNNTFNIAFLPRYFIDYRKSFRIRGAEGFVFHSRIGTFEKFRNYEGLTLYNLDMQGIVSSLTYRRWQLTLTTVADLQFSTGLNIDGIRDYQLALNRIPINQHWQLDLKTGFQRLLGGFDHRQMASFSAALHQKHMRIYAQTDYRFNPNYRATLNYAFAGGITGKHTLGSATLAYILEYRHYGGGFNSDFRNEANTHYRKTDQPVGSNFTGPQVYPLSYLNRPFGQWAVFTEYNTKRWVDGISVQAILDYPFSKQLSWLTETDFHLIAAEGEKTFVYPFYKTGLRIEPLKSTYLSVALTNKTMNLDNYYTSYYLLKHPAFQFELRRDLSVLP